jgi:hypothetical protein
VSLPSSKNFRIRIVWSWDGVAVVQVDFINHITLTVLIEKRHSTAGRILIRPLNISKSSGTRLVRRIYIFEFEFTVSIHLAYYSCSFLVKLCPSGTELILSVTRLPFHRFQTHFVGISFL